VVNSVVTLLRSQIISTIEHKLRVIHCWMVGDHSSSASTLGHLANLLEVQVVFVWLESGEVRSAGPLCDAESTSSRDHRMRHIGILWRRLVHYR
jgi:hypothetical protein